MKQNTQENLSNITDKAPTMIADQKGTNMSETLALGGRLSYEQLALLGRINWERRIAEEMKVKLCDLI